MYEFGEQKKTSALQAKFDAQKIAFAPIVFQATLALRNLGILDLLLKKRKSGVDTKTVAEDLNLPLYGVKVLLEAGLGAELVYQEDDRYHLTKTGYFILTDPLTQVNMNFVADICYDSMPRLEDSIVNKKPLGLESFGDWKTIYEGLSQLPEKAQKSWFEFDHYYSDIAFPLVLPQVFASNPKHIVDVGGNTGRWTKCCLEFNDQVHVSIVDLPGQLDKAKTQLNDAGFAGRFSTQALDLLQDDGHFPAQADVIWMSQFLDCFSETQITRILQRARTGMEKNTRLYILETFWDRQQFTASAFSLVNTSLYFTCIANGNSKMYHSNDLKRCAETAGLVLKQQTDDIGIGHTLLEYALT